MKRNNIFIKISIIAFFVMANVVDFYSTIIQTPNAEENLVIRIIWGNGGDASFLVFKMLMTFIPAMMVWELDKKIYYFVLTILGLFILLIALTNLALIPYSWTSWFNF